MRPTNKSIYDMKRHHDFSRGSVATGASGRQAPRTGIQHRLLKDRLTVIGRLRVNVPTVAEPL